MAEAADDLGLAGKEIGGRYRLDRFIGAGTMGAVYAGTQIAVGRQVAVKVLNAALQTNQEVKDRFRIEAQAIATLSHPNCVTLFDFGFAEEIGALFMAVEYLDGQSLDRLIERGLPTMLALSLSRQIADVLAVAHGAGIMHRDLKPENVMVVQGADGSAQAKVLDFGLARIFEDATGGARLTRQGQLFGTPAYMSPEQCRSAMDVGPPSDIYALGVSMFEMISGRLPFDSPSVPELLVLHSTKTAPPVPVNDDLPLEVSALIARMMLKIPDERPTAGDVVATLSAVLQGRPTPALTSVGTVRRPTVLESAQTLAFVAETDGPPEGVPGSSKRNVAISSAIVAIGAVAVAVGLWAAGSDSSDANATPAVEVNPVIEVVAAAPEADAGAPELPPIAATALADEMGSGQATQIASAAEAIATDAAAERAAAKKTKKSKSTDKPKARSLRTIKFSYE